MRKRKAKRSKGEEPGDGRRRRQAGGYALEFALVFPVFFLLFYSLLAMGLIFLARQSMVLAAEDGARAALRYFSPAPGGAGLPADLMAGRLAHGCDVATARLAWLRRAVDASSAVLGCQGYIDDPACLAPVWAGQSGSVCVARLVVRYRYADAPLVPWLPLIGAWQPQRLDGVAPVLIDAATLQLHPVETRS